MGAAQTREYVDRRYEDRDVNELPDAPLAKPAQGLDRGVGQLVDVAVLKSPVDVLPCLGSSHGWIASLVIRMVRRRAGIGAGRRDG